ncbi:MAG: prepilin-type N-terminal cleavage/methylation domain-containing protein [Candidatus Omnitrophica bacterium]|nr:prepilin-type N-terminal cleavage/methylation domain-containing protein [Candidatus Omnitrophota bacterium]
MIKKKNKIRGLTLIELLLTVVLIGVLVLALASIQKFAFHHVIASERRAKLQNDGYLILEHIIKNLLRATGSSSCEPSTTAYYCLPVVIGTISGSASDPYQFLQVRLNENGTYYPPATSINDDTLVSYLWKRPGADAPGIGAYSLAYCSNQSAPSWIISPGSLSCTPGWEVLSSGNVANFSAAMVDAATININLTMRYNTSVSAPTNLEDNPEVNLTTTVHIPGASAN